MDVTSCSSFQDFLLQKFTQLEFQLTNLRKNDQLIIIIELGNAAIRIYIIEFEHFSVFSEGQPTLFLLIFLGIEKQEYAKKSKKWWEISGKMRNLPKFFYKTQEIYRLSPPFLAYF